MERETALMVDFIIIDFSGASGTVKTQQYNFPSNCIHCGCKLSAYNPLDACYPCQERGRKCYHRIAKKMKKEMTGKEVLEILRKNNKD